MSAGFPPSTGVRDVHCDARSLLWLASCRLQFPHTPPPIAQNTSVCFDRRADLQRKGSQRFPQG